MTQLKCCICGKEIEKEYNNKGEMVWDEGNNPFPVKLSGRCCRNCDETIVIPARLLPKEDVKKLKIKLFGKKKETKKIYYVELTTEMVLDGYDKPEDEVKEAILSVLWDEAKIKTRIKKVREATEEEKNELKEFYGE
jgi:hypothetical protein